MADTKDFDVVRVARSDGADTGPGYWPTTASKKPKDTVEKTTRVKPQMIRLSEDDPRYAEWRVKLGILLKQELAPTPDEGNAWYVQFPRGYWLYEKSKHLWVSGYPIKAKLYKTPQEFAVHLVWLLSSSQDYKDCCCVHCNPSTKAEDTPILTPESPAKTTPKVTPVPLPPMPGSKPAPRPVSQWSLQSPLLFRSGELVWYQTGNTWRLGIIANYTTTGYELIPMGYALVPQANITKNDTDMRPYQAFSVPPVAVTDLTDKVFDEIPWETMFRSSDASQRDILLLDASKLAASKVDYSYSLWSPTSPPSESKTITYYGCFLGAERVEIGDCLRVKNLPPELNIQHEFPVLGLRYIFTSTDFPGSVFFRGSLYFPGAGNDPSAFVPDEALPIALRDEVHWRNQSPGARRGWILAKEDVVLKESSIRGRFYPTHRLMPILNPAEFQAAVARGQDAPHPYLNSRMDGYGRYLGRKMNRLDALGAGVTQGSHVAVENHIREEGYA